MRRVGRLVPPLARAACQPRSAACFPHAGPSKLPLVTPTPRRALTSTPISSLPRSSQPPPPPTDSDDPAATAPAPSDADLAIIENEQDVDELSLLEDEEGFELTAEDLARAKQEDEYSATAQLEAAFAQRAAQIHDQPIGPSEPIVLPLSNLAQRDPSGPDASGTAIALPRDMFDERIRRDILHRCVVWYRSAMRQGTHKQKGRSEVSYSGRKLRPQKKTGKARLGDRSNPMLKGGARAFPKRPRIYATLLPRKIRALGMRVALSMKLQMGLLRCVEDLNSAGWTRTNEAWHALTGRSRHPSEHEEVLGIEGVQAEGLAGTNVDTIAGELGDLSLSNQASSTPRRAPVGGYEADDKLSILFVYPHTKPASEVKRFAMPLRNIPGVEIMSTDEVQVYHILKHRWLVLEAGAVDVLSLQKGQPRLEADDPEWVDEETVTAVADGSFAGGPEGLEGLEGLAQIGSSDSTASILSRRGRVKRPQQWLVHRWRKLRGSKSMRRTFGMRHATAMEVEAKKTWKRIARVGANPTPDMVAMAIAGKHVWPERRKQRIVAP